MNPETPLPVSLAKADDRRLVIEWNDGAIQKISFRKLRDSCRCATCNDKREKQAAEPVKAGELPILSAAEAQPIELLKMHPVGNYAYSLHFSDGHGSGIFTFEMLRSIGDFSDR